MAYVYILFDWLWTPRYVGWGKKKFREADHWLRTDPGNPGKNEFIERTWTMLGEIPHARIFTGMTETAAKIEEVRLIRSIGRTDLGRGPLMNLTDGGDGVPKWGTAESRSASTKRSWLIRSRERQSIISKNYWASFTAEERRAIMQRRRKLTPEEGSERARKSNAARTPEQRSAAVRKANESRTPERRSEIAQYAQLSSATHEERSERARRIHAARTPERRKQIMSAANARWKNRKIDKLD